MHPRFLRSRARALLLSTLMAACSNEPNANAPVRQRGVLVRPGQLPPPVARPHTKRPPESPREPQPSAAAVPVANALPAQQATPDEPEKPARNLQNELESMFGSPASCLAERSADQAPAQLRIALRASIMPSGAVGRGEVSAPGLSADEIDCVRSRLEALHFAQPIDDAPRTVSGSVTLQRGS